MKYWILITSFFLSSFISYAQFDSFAPVGATWKCFYESDGTPSHAFNYFVEKDTLIQGKTCSIIEYDGPGVGKRPEIVYSDGNQLFVYRKEDFHLLFDFDAAVGDTIVVFDEQFDPFFLDSYWEEDTAFLNLHNYFAYTIVAKDSVNIDGQWLQQQELQTVGNGVQTYSDWEIYSITELLGTGTARLFGVSNQISITGDHVEYMYCYEEEGLALPVSEDRDCDNVILGVNDINLDSKDEIFVFPNPAKDIVTFQIRNQTQVGIFQNANNESLKIFNSLGQLVKQSAINRLGTDGLMEQSISIGELPQGIYYWKLGNGSGKILKE